MSKQTFIIRNCVRMEHHNIMALLTLPPILSAPSFAMPSTLLSSGVLGLNVDINFYLISRVTYTPSTRRTVSLVSSAGGLEN